MNFRKSFAGALIRLSHRVYRPRVTVDHSVHFNGPISLNDITRWREQQEKLLGSVRLHGADGSSWDISGSGGGGGGVSLPPDDGPACC